MLLSCVGLMLILSYWSIWKVWLKLSILPSDSLHRSLGKTITRGQCVKQNIYYNTITAHWNNTMQLQQTTWLTRVPLHSSLRLDQISKLLQQVFTEQMPFTLPNSQHQSSEGNFFTYFVAFLNSCKSGNSSVNSKITAVMCSIILPT